ncbi:terpenoid cyclases/protein prenyltransferase alpha-alpha toroid, partial [Lactifluus volemus]
LAILWDDYSLLDCAALTRKVGSCQGKDGGFVTLLRADDTDLRMTYCAFVVCALLNNWSCIDLPRALSYIQRYRTYEGGYGQTPLCESLGGLMYCALASMHLVPAEHLCDFAGASTTHQVARDCAMVAAHAITTDATDADGGKTGWRLCGADEQTGGCVLWVLVRCRSCRMSLPFSIPCRAINSQHTQHACDSFPFFFS